MVKGFLLPISRSAVFFTLFGLSSLLQAEHSKSILSLEELKDLAPKIEAAENALMNVKIESETWLETKISLSDPCENWQQTPIYRSQTAWALKRHDGKARVAVHKEIFEWRDGASKFGERSFSVGFDGKDGRWVQHTVGPLGQSRPVKRATILPKVPEGLKDSKFDSGAYYSLPFFDAEVYQFSEMFRLGSDPNSEVASELKFSREEFQGVQCIKISSEYYGVTYWLDPAHGFALRGKKSIAKYEDGHEELVTFTEVSKLKEVGPSMWWPVEVSTVSRPCESGKPYRRFTYRASSVVANDPNFDEGVFTVPFPDGYLIDDQVAGKKYRVGAK